MAASKKGTGRKGSGQEDSGITNVFLVLLLFAVLMLLIVYFSNKKKEEDVNNVITPTPQVSVENKNGKEEGKIPDDGNAGTKTGQNGENPQGADQSGENRGDGTKNNDANDNSSRQGESGPPPAGTEPDDAMPAKPESQEDGDPQAAAQPAESTPTPEPTDAPSPDDLLTKGEEEDILAGEIQEKDYSYQLSDENMELDGKTGQDTVEGMTEEKAKQLLSKFSAASLMLPASLDECSLSLDGWQTVVGGEECYCLNVFYKDALAGNIYFTEDGRKVYYLDEFGEFIPVK